MAKSDVVKELVSATAINSLREDEDIQAFLLRMHTAVDKLKDKDWDQLSDGAQRWFNSASDAITARKPLPVPSGIDAKPAKASKTAKADKPAKAAKTDKPAKKAKTEKSGAGRKPTIDDGSKIKLLVKENPRRKGSAVFKLWGIYQKSKTVGAAVEAGATYANIRTDVARGNISLQP